MAQEFYWSDYSTIPDTVNQNVQLTERECNFILSLLAYAQNRSRWTDISDADWDTVEDFLAQVDTKLMGAF